MKPFGSVYLAEKLLYLNTNVAFMYVFRAIQMVIRISISLFLMLPICCFAQNYDLFHIDVNNGLPSNHIYRVIVDRHGYLWMATPNGVVRYNGYEFTYFNISNGLPTNDVWNLFEGNNDKIWLGTIADKFGYIKNNTYHTCISTINGIIYPENFISEGKLLIFNSVRNDKIGPIPIYIINDTIKSFDIFSISERFLICFGKIFSYNANGTLLSIGIDGKKHIIKSLKNTEAYKDKLLNYYETKYNDIYWNVKDNHFFYLDSSNFHRINLPNKKDHIITIIPYKDYLYIYSEAVVYKYGIKKLRLYKTIVIDTSFKNKQITGILDDSLWNNITITEKNGIYIQFQLNKNHISKIQSYLKYYTFISSINDSIFCWWNNKTHDLLIERNNAIEHINIPSESTIFKIIKDNKYLLVLTHGLTYYVYKGKKGSFFSLFRKKEYSIHNAFNPSEWSFAQYFRNIKDAVLIGNKKMYVISGSVTNLSLFNKYKDSLFIQSLDMNKYNHIFYDSFYKKIWVYGTDRILLMDTFNKKTIIAPEIVNRLGIRVIEKVYTDKYGNIFIKDFSHLFLINFRKHLCEQLFKNINLNNVFFEKHNDYLILAGDFGVLISEISSTGRISKPIFYKDIKKSYYSYIYNAYTYENKIILNTNKGFFAIKFPDDSLFDRISNRLPYRLNVTIADSIIDITENDTINVLQEHNRLRFDVINPVGNGKLKFQYKILTNDSLWHPLEGNELFFSKLYPGKYQTLSIIAYDNAWISNETKIKIYFIPYWWQTNLGRNILWIATILILIALVYATYLIAKAITIRQSFKRNQRLEMELKSIYAQINPHFIFNTLNSGLYYIQNKMMDDAYIHISKFSRLLRAYIKSSRNKYITIKDEIINLKNYIELQQTRFKNKFDYKITVNDKVNIETTNVPTLLLQPLVENAINHGLFHKEGNGQLNINFDYDTKDNLIICIIDDNGIGRKAAKLLYENSSIKHESYGDQLIKDLIKIFNTYEDIKIEIDYIDKEEPYSGTTVIVKIKYTK